MSADVRIVVGNILESDCHVIVNPVNSVGVMGAGLAKQIAARFPWSVGPYQSACSDWFDAGHAYLVRGGTPMDPDIIHLATKRHWRDPSRLEYVEDGLVDLVEIVARHGAIKSVAVPALGCGLGGLAWEDVEPLIVEAAGAMPRDTRVDIYAPVGVVL